MFNQEFTTYQYKNNCVLFSSDGLQRRIFPSLEEEIGEDPASLLLQLDYWIGNRGFVREGRRWIKMSAKTISKWAFRTWSQRKVQREIKALHDADLILVEYFDGPYTTPYIALNLTTIATKLKAVRILETAVQKEETPAVPPEHDPIEQPPARPAAPAEKIPDEVRGSSPVLEVIIYHTFTSTATMAGIDILDGKIDTVDAPPPTAAAIPPSTPATTLKENTATVSTDALGDQSKKIKEPRKESKKRESAQRADRAKRVTPSLQAKKQSEINPPSESNRAPEWDKFCRKLAEICAVDFDIDPGYVRAWASKIWKNGNNGKGYTTNDLDDFIVWWNTYDWRGAKNHTLPTPKQVVELIRQSYEHKSTRSRRDMRARGYSPDEVRYRYISGELAEYVNY